jgi:hypothetical protein
MSDTEVRFYREWSPIPGAEVSEDTARSLTAYGRALFTDGAPRVLEMYSRGRLLRVEYRGAVDQLPGVRFAVRMPGQALGDLRWSILRQYTDHGTLEGFLVQLIDAAGRALTEVSYNVEGGRIDTTKYSYEDGRLRYVLEYDKAGELVDLYDSPAGESPRFEDVLAAVPDSAFYADGAALPSGVTPGPGDSPDEMVRREVARPEPVRSGRDDQGLA